MNEFEPKLDSPEHHRPRHETSHERNHETAEKRVENHEKEIRSHESDIDSLEAIRDRLDKTAESRVQTISRSEDKPRAEAVHHASTGMKHHSYKQTLKSTRRKLTTPERAFSKVIHQPVVETVSDFAGGTVARPSGLLVGGLVSAAASLVVLYICRHYGYEYNFLIGLAGMGGGFVLGLLSEGAYKLANR